MLREVLATCDTKLSGATVVRVVSMVEKSVVDSLNFTFVVTVAPRGCQKQFL